MAVASISGMSQIAKRTYADDAAYVINAMNDGISELFQSRAKSVKIGEDSLEWLIVKRFPGSFSTNTETGTAAGSVGNQAVQSSTYANLRTDIGDAFGQIEFTWKFVKWDKLKQRIQTEPFKRLIMDHLQVIARHDYLTTIFGASGFVNKVASGTKTNVTGNIWSIPIDQDTSSSNYRYSPTGHALLPGMHVQIVHATTHAVLDDGSNDYVGVVDDVDDGVVYIEWDQAMASTNTHVTGDYAIRLYRPDSTLEKYGVPDFVGDQNSAYIDDGLSAQNKYPYGTGELGRDPDTDLSWRSTITTYAGEYDLSDLDACLEKWEKRYGKQTKRSNLALITSPDMRTKQVQQQRPYERFQPTAPNDRRAGNRETYDNGEPFYLCRFAPKGVITGVDVTKLGYDELQKAGPEWVHLPDMNGNMSGAVFQRDLRTRKFVGQTTWPGQRVSMTRGHMRVQPSGS